MSLQNVSTTESRLLNAFHSILEDIPGGVTLKRADFVQSRVLAGQPIGIDTNGLGIPINVAKLQADAADNATAYRVLKGHNFKVGQFIASAEGAKAYAITAIDTSNAAYDQITVGTTLGVAMTAAAGVFLFEAAEEAANDQSALKFAPVGLVANTIDFGVNSSVKVCVRGTVKIAVAPPIGPVVSAKLPLIRFV